MTPSFKMPLLLLLLALIPQDTAAFGIIPLIHPAIATLPAHGDVHPLLITATLHQALPLSSLFSPQFQLSSTTTLLAAAGGGDGGGVVQNVAIGIAILVALAAATTVYVQQSVIPEQINNMAVMVRDSQPEVWADIVAELGADERVRDRPDLISKVTDAALELMKDETEESMKRLVVMIKNEQQNDEKGVGSNMSNLRPAIEAAVGCSIGDFLAKVDKNANSEYLSTDRKELAELLRTEFCTSTAAEKVTEE
jgi:hypothetical protein